MPEIRNTIILQLSLLLLLLGLSTQNLYAEVQAILSQQSTNLDQPVRLSLQTEGEQELSPDLSVLDKDFEILGRSSQQSISVINGQMTSKRSLMLTLLPKRAGTLTIPPIPFGQETTDALTLQVTEQSQESTQNSQKQAKIELSLNQDSAYLEEEVILTLRLYQAPGVRGEALTMPEASNKDAQLKLIHEDRYNSQQDGIEYRVSEQVYAVFASQPGTLTLSGAKFRGHSGGSRDPFLSLFSNSFTIPQQTGRIIRSESNSVSLEIMPIPDAFTGDRWLPARNLQIVDSGLNNQSAAIAGKPLTRRIMLIADGLMSSQLPALEQQMPPGIKLYPERPQLNDRTSRKGYSSTLQQSLTLIATDEGSYTLPALEIPWWNTETQQQEIARLAAREISFMPNPAIPNPASQAGSQADDSEIQKESEPSSAQSAPAAASSQPALPWLALVLGLAWLVTLFAWWISSRRNKPAAKSLQPEPAPKNASQYALKQVLERLASAYQDQDAVSARGIWLEWARLNWPDNPPNNLSRLARRCDTDLAAAVNALERALYSPTAQSSWSTYKVLQLIENRQAHHRLKPSEDKGVLVPLNP
jgi:hypothetical protein